MKSESIQQQAIDVHAPTAFGDYTVTGIKYQDADANTAWHITSQGSYSEAHDFWVSGHDFHPCATQIFHENTPINLIRILETPVTTGIEQAERDAVLEAIAEWNLAAGNTPVRVLYSTSGFPHKNNDEVGQQTVQEFKSLADAKKAPLPAGYEFAFIRCEDGSWSYETVHGWRFRP